MRIRITVEIFCGEPNPDPLTCFRAKVDQDMKTVNLNWDYPTTRVDGSPLAASEIAGVQFFMSADGGANFAELDFIAAPETAHIVPDLVEGAYIIRGVVVDKGQRRSGPRDASVSFGVPPVEEPPVPTELAAPSPLPALRFTIT
jgi:hypothetical protein